MALDFPADEPLSLSSLVVVEEDLEPYVLEWPTVPDADGVSEALVLAIMKREAGLLLAVPTGFAPQGVLDRANAGQEAGPIGASTVAIVPGVIVEDGMRSPTGSQLEVLIVDVSADLVRQLRPMLDLEEIACPFDLENPYSLPSPAELLRAARDWISAAGEDTGLAFYSAEGGQDLEEEGRTSGDSALPRQPPPPRRARRSAKPAATPTGGASSAEKPKRVTTASLAASMDQLLAVVPSLSGQLQELTKKQQMLEDRLVAPSRVGALGLSQPLSATMPQPVAAGAVAKALHVPPPRTRGQLSLDFRPAMDFKPEELTALEEEKPEAPPPEGDLAKAMLVQSQALTALVSQIASSSQDPLADLTLGVQTASTRGATGRARLQAELATHSGAFFQSVLRSMARRMQPTMPATGSPEDLLRRGICGTLYMERYGGFGRHRDLGLLLYQVMGILDFLQAGNVGAAQDATALLAVCIDQAVLDGGRFDLAALLTLQEDPPSAIFVNRQQSVLARSRAFSQLADQKWITTALAFVKELDLITTKRQELSGQAAGSQKGQPSSEPSAKPKAQAKRKGKGNAKGHPASGAQEAEEE